MAKYTKLNNMVKLDLEDSHGYINHIMDLEMECKKNAIEMAVLEEHLNTW